MLDIQNGRCSDKKDIGGMVTMCNDNNIIWLLLCDNFHINKPKRQLLSLLIEMFLWFLLPQKDLMVCHLVAYL